MVERERAGRWKGWLIAAAAVALATALRVAVEPWLSGRLPYITIFGGVAIAVWRGGPACAVLCAAAGFLAVNRLVANHPGADAMDTPGYWIALAGFGVSSGLIILFGAWTQRELARRRAAEAVAAELGERLQATLTSIGDGVIVADDQGRVTSLNPVAETLTGWSSDDARGQPLVTVFDIVNEDTGEPVENPALRALAEGRIVGLANHTVLRARTGPHRAIDDSAAPIRLPDGRISGAVLVFRDSSARRAQEQALGQSEALLRAMYEGTAMSMGVVELLDDGDILHLQDNAGTCRLFGVPPGGTANRRASELGAAPAMIALWTRHYRESERLGAPVSFEFQLQTPEGLTWHRATVSLLPPVDGGRPRFSYLADDITAQIAAERVVRQSEAKARMALEVARIGIWSWDPDLDLIEADARCRTVAGLPERGALRLDDAMSRVHDADRDAVMRSLTEALVPDGPGLYTAEFRFVHADGGVRWVVARGQVLTGAQLAADGRRLMLGSLVDITARKQAEEELAGSDRRKSEFIATLAHELRNPLAPIRNGLAILQRADDAASRRRTVPMLERQVSLLVRMIDDLLDLSRINRNQLALQRQPLDMVAVLHAAVEVSEPLITAQRHRLDLRLPDGPVPLVGDPARLTQLFANLLNNAAKYTPEGGTIALQLEPTDGGVVVTVADDGIGIPPEMLQRVFEMFAQVDRSTPQARSGLGIGLSIGRRLAQLHGGTIAAYSDGEGRGSRFVVTLPASPPGEPAPAPPDAAPPAAQSARTVLVVDDNVDAASTMCELLALMGHAAHAAHDGTAALELAERLRPDVVFLDIGMPKMDGHAVARQLRLAPWSDGLLLVALTGWGQAEDRERSKASGFDRHLVKPVGFADIEALMQAAQRPS